MASAPPAFELFVGGLRHSTNERQLLDVFQRFGEVEKLQIKRHKDTHKSLGYAFITFQAKDAWERALNFGPEDIEGRPVSIKVANQAADIVPGRRRRQDQAVAPPGFDKRRLQRNEEQHCRSERSPVRAERSDTRHQLPPPPPPLPPIDGASNDQTLRRSPSPSPVEAKRRRTRSPSPVRNGVDTFARTMTPSPAPAEQASMPLPVPIDSSEPLQPVIADEAQPASAAMPTPASADRYSPHGIALRKPEGLEQRPESTEHSKPASSEPPKQHTSPETNRQSSPSHRQSSSLHRQRNLEGHRSRAPDVHLLRERSSNDKHRHQAPELYRGRSPELRRPQANPPPAYRPRSPQLRRPRSPEGRRGKSPPTKVPRARSPVLHRTRSPEPWRPRSPDARRAVVHDVRRLRSPELRRPVVEVQRHRNPSPRIARPAMEVAPLSASGSQQLYYELQDASERQVLLKQQVDMLTRKSEMGDRRLELLEAKTRELETYLDAAYKEIQQLHNRFQQVVPYARQSERLTRGGAQVSTEAARMQNNAGSAGPDGSNQRYSEPYTERNNNNHSKYPRQNHFDDSDNSEPSR